MIEKFKKWANLRTDRRGVTALEYALLAALIGVVIAGGATTLGTKINNMFTTVGSKISAT